jgi:uncharacterized protein involved in exopolysaccharide biosynthesis
MLFETERAIDFREVRRVLWRRRAVIGLPALVTVVAAAVGSMFVAPKYEATSTLSVDRPVALTREVRAAAGQVQEGRSKDAVRAFRSRILAASFLESVAVQIGLHEHPRVVASVEALAAEHPDYPKKDLVLRECVARLTRMLDIRSDGGDVFYVRAVAGSPEMACAVARTVAEQYIQTTRQTQLSESEEAHDFAEEQMAIYEKKLEEKRRQLREYEQNLAIKPLSSSPVSKENINRVNTMVAAAESEVEFLGKQVEASALAVDEASLGAFLDLGLLRSERLSALKQTLLEQERHYALTLVEYEDRTPPVMAAEGQIAVKSQQVLAELETLTEAAFPSLAEGSRRILVDHMFAQVKLQGVERRVQEFRDFLDRYARDLANVPAEEFRLDRLQEEVRSAERLYDTWLEQANATQIAKAVQSASVGEHIMLLQEADLPLHPFAPDRRKIVLIATIMGIALGLGAAVVAEYLDLTLKSVAQIEAVLGVPILGAVPRTQAAVLRDAAIAHGRRIRMVAISAVATAILLAALGWWWFAIAGAGIS